ncbi:HalOD1 output domain-containing protein [Natronobacterium gregoryi]|uniref:Halobacterial output domain-containing protein n=2 Tax=Natronobacterium gregoryi TaxID=44930 RepID=L0AG69_NATGS|nr:HalOD1 output domain-containing protein [Natronobacterium gregoryi]AFZ72132.1 hypothetical protein Natgr_0894 [Natronobacterium gregoryi SP2]ELY62838.1 hypothetical protein C490_16783 [Natronobacterium gregoryi SP2]PLK19293.1 hypothetical protein CYV19_15705 [Natronobacterium gregoryi SP2]SFJ54770.1 hypothetical protein SAMN05443661_13813 [Natronobacterium gregoryi]
MTSKPPVSFRIAQAVAEHEGTTVEELHPPLHDAIDTEALDAIFRTDDSSRVVPAIEFSYKKYAIQVDSPDEIIVRESASPAEPRTEAV